MERETDRRMNSTAPCQEVSKSDPQQRQQQRPLFVHIHRVLNEENQICSGERASERATPHLISPAGRVHPPLRFMSRRQNVATCKYRAALFTLFVQSIKTVLPGGHKKRFAEI